jgi:hypothetical protein
LSTPVENLTVPPGENLTDRRGDEPQFVGRVTGCLVLSAFGIIVLVFLTDFVKIALSTDRVEGLPQPATWDMKVPVLVGAAIGVLMVTETLALLWAGWWLFDFGSQEPVLQTFSFQMLFYFALFSIVSARERRRFWASWPSGTLVAALCLDAVAGCRSSEFPG